MVQFSSFILENEKFAYIDEMRANQWNICDYL